MTNTFARVGAFLGGVLIAVASFSLITTSQADASSYRWRERTQTPNIAEVAINNGNFTTLVSALQCTGLDRVVASKWVRLTVFAPTDDAFGKLNLNADNVCETFDKRTLRNILLYHVSWGKKDSTRVLSSSSLRMLNWQRAPIDASVPSIGGAEINTALIDIKASNGIVHVVNDVMLPQ